MRLHMTTDQYRTIRQYLAAPTEQIAFCYTHPAWQGKPDQQVVGVELPARHHYTASSRHGAELTDDVRPHLIQHAHHHGHGLVEAHEHAWPGPRTRFSGIDLDGLADLGPHMTWRLPGRPYIALVFGVNSLDALVFHPNRDVTGLDEIHAGDQILRPTGLSLPAYTALSEGVSS